jgi:hypothetical protein
VIRDATAGQIWGSNRASVTPLASSRSISGVNNRIKELTVGVAVPGSNELMASDTSVQTPHVSRSDPPP